MANEIIDGLAVADGYDLESSMFGDDLVDNPKRPDAIFPHPLELSL